MDVDSESDEEAPIAPEETAEVRARKEFLLYKSKKTSATLQISLVKPDGLVNYWKNQGAKDYPVLALSQLGTPPGSGVLENDFSTFANLLTCHR